MASPGGTAPLVSIIIPAYGQEDFALQAVTSALSQDYPALEVIFVDDASPDVTYEAVRAITDPRLRTFRNAANLGRTGNYRHALYDLARGDWVLLLDGDDYLTDPAFVRSAVEAGGRDRDILIVAGRAVTQSRAGAHTSAIPGEVVFEGLDLLDRLPGAEYLFMHMATVYRRQAALETDFYRVPHLSSDFESLYRLAARGKVAFIDRVAGVWRIHGVNASESTDSAELGRNLSVWPAIFAAAVDAGMPKERADRNCRRCLAFIMRENFPALFRKRGWGRLREYCRHAATIDRKALLQAALSPLGAARLAAGAAGYYRVKSR